MKKFFLVILSLIIIFSIYIINKHAMLYVYMNPYTNTKTLPYISSTIKMLNNAFEYAKFSSHKGGNDFKYLYYNAYGSGFIKRNPIPNDLDFAVGVHLGEYNYDGKNGNEIAHSIVDKMNSFETSFNFYINMNGNNHTFTTTTPLGQMDIFSKQYKTSVENIADSLDTALLGNNYVKYTQKHLEDSSDSMLVDVPYIMKSNEILMENRKPMILYSDLVNYNPFMPHYMREISIIPEYYATINYKGKNYLVEIVPESFLGNRLQLSRRIFASTVFVHNSSAKFLENAPFFNKEEDYLFYRMLSFKRHLQDINNILVMEDRPVKLFKRLIQTADMVYPVLEPKTYQEISDFVYENLSSKNIQLLNEYTNICGNLYAIMETPKLFFRLQKNGKLEDMYKTLEYTVKAMEQSDIDKQTVLILKNYQEKELNGMFNLKNENELKAYKERVMENEYGDIAKTAGQAVLASATDRKKIQQYIGMFNKIYIDAGYHKVSLYWLDNNTLGVVEDDFTKNIKDFKAFAKENDLIDINYKLIKPENVPDMKMRYDVFARFNSSAEENRNYERFQKLLLDDKANFKTKRKLVWVK